MTTPSNWTLHENDKRNSVPKDLLKKGAHDPLTKDLFPLWTGVYHYAKGHHVKRVMSDDDLLIYCINGMGKLIFRSQEYTIQAGDLLHLPANEAHEYYPESNRPWGFYWITYNGQEKEAFNKLLPKSNTTPFIYIGLEAAISREFTKIVDLWNNPFTHISFFQASCYLKALFAKLSNYHAPHLSIRGKHFPIESIYQYFEEHLHQQLQLNDLAKHFHLSSFYFNKRYKEIVGIAPIAHFIQMKIKKACHLLDRTECSIAEIAHSIGYEDPFYFSRLFKKNMDCSPTAYRKSI